MKSKKSITKRFKKKNNKLYRFHSGKRHNLRKKSKSFIRSSRRSTLFKGKLASNISRYKIY